MIHTPGIEPKDPSTYNKNENKKIKECGTLVYQGHD